MHCFVVEVERVGKQIVIAKLSIFNRLLMVHIYRYIDSNVIVYIGMFYVANQLYNVGVHYVIT